LVDIQDGCNYEPEHYHFSMGNILI